MNSKYIRVGCLVVSLILFLFTGWFSIKSAFRSRWESEMGNMMEELQYYVESFAEYGDFSGILGGGMDMDVFKDVEKFLKSVADGSMSPMEIGIISTKFADIAEGLSAITGSGMDEDMEAVILVMRVFAAIFWLTLICGIVAIVMAFLGRGKVLNVFYMIGEILILALLFLICVVANESAGAKIIGTGFWPVLSIILAIAALCFKTKKAAVAGGVPPYAAGGMNGGYQQQMPYQAQPQYQQPPYQAQSQYQQPPYQAQPQMNVAKPKQGWRCPQCGAAQKDDSRFCAICGTPKPQPQPVMQPQPPVQAPSEDWICPTCGAIQSEDSRFCSVCGKPKPVLQNPVEVQRQQPTAPMFRQEPVEEKPTAPMFYQKPAEEKPAAPTFHYDLEAAAPMFQNEVSEQPVQSEEEDDPIISTTFFRETEEPEEEPRTMIFRKAPAVSEAPAMKPQIAPMMQEPKVQSNICKVCGAELQPEDLFCPECGSQTNNR